VRLYFYSSELHTYVEAKWAKTAIAVGGILMGAILFFGVIEPNKSIGNSLRPRSTHALAAENDVLRRHASLISPRLDDLEATAGRLDEHVNALRTLLLRRQIARDSVWRLTRVADRRLLRSMVQATAGFRR